MSTPTPGADQPTTDAGHLMPVALWEAIDHNTAERAIPDPALLLVHAQFLDGHQ